MKHSWQRLQRGVTIVSAIFILVVLAALGAFIVTVSTSQQIGSALDVQGSRAFQAARSGIEWGVYQVQATAAYAFGHANDPGVTSPNLRSCASAAASFTFPAAPSLAGFSVTVTCVRTPVDDTPANNPFNSPAVYTVTATACNQPNGGVCPNTTNPDNFYIERRLEVSF